jgi:hypothetical protein
MGKKEGTVAVYGGGLKLVCLGLVIRKRWYINCCSRPVGDENELDDVNLILTGGLAHRLINTVT